MRGRIDDYPTKRPRLEDDNGRKWRRSDHKRHHREKQSSRREWQHDSFRRDDRKEEKWQDRHYSHSYSHSLSHSNGHTEDSIRDRPKNDEPIRRDKEHVRISGEAERSHEDGAIIKAKLKQAIIEQDQAFVRLVEERRCQVRRLEEQSKDVQRQLAEAQRKLVEAEIQLKKLRERNDLDGSQGYPFDGLSNNKSAVPSDSHQFDGLSNGKSAVPPGSHHSDGLSNDKSAVPSGSHHSDGLSNGKSAVPSGSHHSDGLSNGKSAVPPDLHHRDASSKSHSTVPLEPHHFHAQSNGKDVAPSKVEPVKVKDEPQDHTDIPTIHNVVSVAPGPNPIIISQRKSELEKPPQKDQKAEQGKSDSGNSSVINIRLESEVCVDIVEHVGCYTEPTKLNVLSHHYFPVQHKRRPRCLQVNPKSTSEQIFASSALDGFLNLWQLRDDGKILSLHQSVQCSSRLQRRWPESISWHPSGDSLFACYSADGKDDQVAIIKPSSEEKITFLTAKPHDKGIINSIVFLPWNEGSFFATGGCDHCVVLWKEETCDNWKPEVLHRSLHTSAVMSACAMQDKPLIVSVGMDKRIIGYDTNQAKETFRYILDMKALDMLPNPVDKNLYMVQTRAPGHQLRLFDVRANYSQIHVFGWNQESTETQSAQISQSWSPDGYYIASGSADPKVHIFDIRYGSKEPTQSINAHQRRVFKAVWHPKLPLLVSVSSDSQMGLIKLLSSFK